MVVPDCSNRLWRGCPTRAELVYAAREEMALTLDDVLSRRTRATIQQGTPASMPPPRPLRSSLPTWVGPTRRRPIRSPDTSSPPEGALDGRARPAVRTPTPPTPIDAAGPGGDGPPRRAVLPCPPPSSIAHLQRRRGLTDDAPGPRPGGTGGRSPSAGRSRAPSPNARPPSCAPAHRAGGRRPGRLQRGGGSGHPHGRPQRRVRGSIPVHGGVALDMTRLGRRLRRRDSLTADVRAGTFGPDLETALGDVGRLYPGPLAPVHGPLDRRRVAGLPRRRPVLDPLREDRGHGASASRSCWPTGASCTPRATGPGPPRGPT